MRRAEIDAGEAARLRHELTATRFVAFGMLLVAALELGGGRRAIVATAFATVAMVAYFLGLRWGLEARRCPRAPLLSPRSLWARS